MFRWRVLLEQGFNIAKATYLNRTTLLGANMVVSGCLSIPCLNGKSIKPINIERDRKRKREIL